ncbi:MAG: hypothetical protein C4K48_05295 [Candidatus Thorarchaeota archaeon]|nr:MAG: hypothetical protein C4K48_05295 [Candidatus Thorarchaeota archaeon]
MRKEKKDKSAEDVTVSELLDDFVSLDIPDNRSRSADVTDEDYVTSMLKKDARKTLAKYRKEPETSSNDRHAEKSTPIKKKEKYEPPVLSERLFPMRRCQNCYYCVTVRTIGGSSWCNCTNPGRSTEESPEKRWIKSRLNLPCWKTKQQ